jgi:hypothetical protein
VFSGETVDWCEEADRTMCKDDEGLVAASKPEDVLVLGAWVEKLEIEQTRPPKLPWDPSLSAPRGIDRFDAGAMEMPLGLNLSHSESM